MRPRVYLLTCLGLAALGLAACGRRDSAPSVVLYSSIDETYAFRAVQIFERKTGIQVKLVSDSEAAKSTGLVNRLILERERPVADVFWSGDIVRALTLQRLGLTAPFLPDDADTLPAALRDPAGHLHGTAARWRMIIYNRNLVPEGAPLPRRLEDLAAPEFASRACLANPLFGTTAIHLAVVFQKWGADRGGAWMQDFARHGGNMVASNGEVKRRVAAGDYAFGVTDSDDVHVALGEGKPVGWIALDVCIPAAAVLLRNSPHPEEGRKLAAFLASAEVEQMLAASEAAHFPVRAGAAAAVFGSLPFPPDQDVAFWRKVEETLQGLLRGDLQRWVDAQR